MKKLKIFLLTLLMVITILPVNTLADENNSSKEPDVSVFATKEQLMDGTFAPDSDGVAKNIGKIVFGKNNTGAPQEWYVLGADSGVIGDNTVIFAADNIRNSPFSNISNNDYSSDVNTARLFMQAMVDVNTTEFFTSHEIELMNKTTITAYQTISDELYLLSADGINSNIIKAGSNDQIKLAMNSYWKNGEDFWLRTNYGTGVLYADTGNVTSSTTYLSESGFLRPASNLNLTNVLFASAAKDNANGKIDANDAMTLRLDGSNMGIGSATVYSDHIEIKKGTNGTDTALFVQGKNGDVNWSYRASIPNNGSVNKVTKTDIINALNITDIDLSKCKVWLEITVKEQRVKYAVEAKQAISNVDINIDVPVDGENLDQTATTNTTGVTVDSITWDPNDTTAGYNKTYTVSIKLSAASGYEFANSVTPKLNGKELSPVSKNTDGTLTVTYQFTAKDTIKEIENPTITVKNGTDISTIQFPDKVKVTGNSSNTYHVIITEWEPDPNNYYDQDCKDEQILKYYANLKEIPGELEYRNNEAPDTTLTLVVKAAEIV
ncbi:MAG: hypothetical protein MR500_00430, partial [Erysipelotrichaceae bacterium]|nr:hypothetical protein [Erysipelotrichaceae bacterium]